MAILTNLFGESPFAILEAHGERVHECIRLLRDVFAAVQRGDQAQLRALSDRICSLETEADKIRNQLHEMMVSHTLLPINKGELFNILEEQDSLADRAEDVANMLTYRDMSLPEPLMKQVLDYVEQVLRNCELARGITSRLDLLVEASFTGRDALTVSKLITELAEREDAIKPTQVEVTRALLKPEASLPPVEAVLWAQVVALLARLSLHADHVGHGIRLILRLKPAR